MISVNGVSMRYGSKVLFEEVSATFSPGRRYGLTGPNGVWQKQFGGADKGGDGVIVAVGEADALAEGGGEGDLPELLTGVARLLHDGAGQS